MKIFVGKDCDAMEYDWQKDHWIWMQSVKHKILKIKISVGNKAISV